jgi:hypothetical protein
MVSWKVNNFQQTKYNKKFDTKSWHTISDGNKTCLNELLNWFPVKFFTFLSFSCVNTYW